MKKIAKILLIFVAAVFALAACNKSDNNDKKAFVAPKDYVNVVQVTINPVVNLYLDKEDVILAVEYVNQDANDTYEIAEDKIVGAKLSEGIEVVVDTAVESGYLADDDKKITVDIIESKEEASDAQAKNEAILETVLESVEKAATNNNINVNVVGNNKGEQVWDVEVEAGATEEATTEEATTEEPTTEEPTTEEPTTEEPTTEEPTTEEPTTEEPTTPAPTDPPTEADKTNPQLYLQKNVEYKAIIPISDEEIEVKTLTFNDEGGCGESLAPYMLIKFEENGDEVEYNGKTWYIAGGGGGYYDKVTLTDKEISLGYVDGTIDVVLKLNQDGTLEVVSSKWADSYPVGLIYTP